jgi:hypothetical protein
MKRIIGVFLVLGMMLLGATACEKEPDCVAACEHQCDVCDTGCDEATVAACVNTCINMDTPASRTDCIIAAPTCDDIWEC